MCIVLFYVWLCCFFFFQAEDGIRDYKVTGVQTCALPIYSCGCGGAVGAGAGRRGQRARFALGARSGYRLLRRHVAAAEGRALLGAFSLDALGHVSQALVDGAAARMLEVVNELERNGQNLQHFSRELARYFRNLLVAKIAGGDTRLIAASAGERQRLAEMAAQFSEEDLTRYLQLSLDLFRDLQFSLQPRFHLELGLLRMVQAGRLVSIEEALAAIGTERASGRGGERAKPAPSPQPPAPRPPSWGRKT